MNTEILELPEFRERIPRFSVEVYEKMPERNENGRRTELIRGIIIEKMSKSPLHAFVTTRVYDTLHAIAPAGCYVRQDQPMRFTDSMPEPDASVVIGSAEDFEEAHPHTAALVVEVAVSTLALDRANVSLYAENGVQEYWIVIAKERAVEVYRNLQGAAYGEKLLLSGDAFLECASIPAIRLPLGSFFSKTPK